MGHHLRLTLANHKRRLLNAYAAVLEFKSVVTNFKPDLEYTRVNAFQYILKQFDWLTYQRVLSPIFLVKRRNAYCVEERRLISLKWVDFLTML